MEESGKKFATRERIVVGDNKRWTKYVIQNSIVEVLVMHSTAKKTYSHDESSAASVTGGGPLGGVGEGGDILVSSAFLGLCLGCKGH